MPALRLPSASRNRCDGSGWTPGSTRCFGASWRTAQLVEDEEVDLVKPSLKTSELARVSRLDERADDVGGTGEEDPSSLARGFDAERDRQVRFAGTDGSCKDDVVGAANPLSAGELGDLRRADGSIGRGEIERVDRLDL